MTFGLKMSKFSTTKMNPIINFKEIKFDI